MTALIRMAGSGRLADGSTLIWTVADGRRGRRWRATAIAASGITHAVLLEVGVEGRLSRLELTTPAGLLTLHPEAQGTALHGNVVTSAGVRHLTFPWSSDHGLEIDGRPIASAVTALRLAGSIGVGESRSVPVVAIGPDLAVREEERRFVRVSATDWRIESDGPERVLAIDGRGIPLGLANSREWPLELD